MSGTPQHAEAAFEMLATALGTVPPEQETLFLAKLCLLLALEDDRPERLAAAIAIAQQDLS